MAQNGKSPDQYQIEDFVTDESFANYFFRLDARDVARWEQWLSENPDRKDTVEAAKEMLRSLTLSLSEDEIDEETAKLKAAIGFDAPPDLRKQPDIVRLFPLDEEKQLRRRKRRRSMLLVSPLLVIVLAGVYLANRLSTHPELVVSRTNNGTAPMTFSLADGTTVTLAPQAVLRYSSLFGEKNRNVFLDGEAQFNVTRKTDQPFEVRENDLLATVLGTTFSVKKQPADSTLVVDLVKGSLKVENINSSGVALTSMILTPAERVVYDRRDQQLYKERWQTKSSLSLEVGQILFERNNFDEVAAKIKAVFGVTMINKSKRRNWMFSGKFENVTAPDIIKNICVVERLDFQPAGDTTYIK